jgi:Fe-S cluster biosynthesis and repair protein YggX
MNYISSIDEIIHDYETVVKVVDTDASEQTDRAYGGVVRTVKGKLQEHITEKIIRLAWKNLGGKSSQLLIDKKKIHIPIQETYVNHLSNKEVREYISKNIKNYFYGLSVDKHIFIDGKFVMGIECKAYTENAMIKRILIDFHLLKTLYPNISCFLFQLESQLGGDYSKLPGTVFGSTSTHSIMSYFEDVDLNIFTFLKGERNIENPIHKNFKPLEHNIVEKAVKLIENHLKEFFI